MQQIQPALVDVIQRCPATRAAVVIGDAWTQLILREALAGACRYSDFAARLGLSRNVLAHRLRRLVELGVMTQRTPAGGGLRQEYQLSASGMDTLGIALMHDDWARTHGTDGESSRFEISYQRDATEKAIHPAVLNRPFGAVLESRRINYMLCGEAVDVGRTLHTRRKAASEGAAPTALLTATDVMGDYWSWAILIAAFFRVRRFDEFQTALNIASNVLTDRLQRLVAANLLIRERYQRTPPRYEYRLAAAGRALHPLFAAMYGWGERWLSGEDAPQMMLFDGITGERITPVVCDLATGAPIEAAALRLRMTRAEVEGARQAV